MSVDKVVSRLGCFPVKLMVVGGATFKEITAGDTMCVPPLLFFLPSVVFNVCRIKHFCELE